MGCGPDLRRADERDGHEVALVEAAVDRDGVIVARLTRAPDPRTVGSGRTGGTNALRAMGAREVSPQEAPELHAMVEREGAGGLPSRARGERVPRNLGERGRQRTVVNWIKTTVSIEDRPPVGGEISTTCRI